MKILLLGANGQLGFDILRFNQAQKSRFEIISVTRSQLDVSQPETVVPFFKDLTFDVLINCTSYHKTDEVESEANKAFAINAHSVQKLAEACHIKNARLIHISTDYVFDGLASKPYLETEGVGPINVYGASKAMGEKLALIAHKQTTIFRVASLFGIAGASGKGGNFVETMIRLAKEKGEVKVVDDIRMSPTSTAEVAKTILRFIELNGPHGIYHLVNSGEASWFEFAEQIIKRTQLSAKVSPILSHEFPTKALRPAYSVLNNSKISNVIGEPLPHWQDALNHYLKEKSYL